MLRRIFIWTVALAAALGAAVGAAYWSGRQEPIDIVRETAPRLGVELESQMIPGSGILLHVVVAGPKDGPPVILLHGFPEFWWAWNQQISRLAKAGFRVFAPDQRGYNMSDKPRAVEDYRVELLVADIIALILRLRYDSVYLAGHDWGGAIAWRLVIEHPEKFRKLVMFNSPHPLAWADAEKEPAQDESIAWFRTFFQLPWLPETLSRAGNWWMLERNLRGTSRPGTFSERDFEYYKYAWDRDESMHSMINWYRAAFRYPPRVAPDAQVAIPTRIVWGMQDVFFEKRMAGLSVKHCSDASLVEVPNAGHWLLHEEPELTSAQMIEFFGAPAPVQ